MPPKTRRKPNELHARLTESFTAVTECASEIVNEAARLNQQAIAAAAPDDLRAEVRALAQSLDGEAVGAVAVLQELRPAAESAALNAAEVVHVLTEIEARLMASLAHFGDVIARLEKAAEADEQVEHSYVAVVEIAARLLARFERAQGSTRDLRDALPRRADGVSPVRRAADGSLVVLEVGAEGGSLTLIGRKGEGGAWRFARITDDQSEALFGEVDLPITAPDLTSLVWVDGWEAGLSLMDRYPWVRLSPQYVHADFVERVKTALEDRLANVDASTADDVRERWERRFARNAPRSRQR